MAQKILIYGVNGSQMGAGAEVLMQRGYGIRIVTRNQDAAKKWAAKGAEIAVGDMADLDAMKEASKGCDAIFLLLPTFRDSDALGAKFGLNAIEAANAAGIKKVIWNTAGPLPDPSDSEASGTQVLGAIKANGMSYLGLQPTVYMENFLGPWTLKGLERGVLSYPTPPGFRIQWGAARDFGLIASSALKGDLPNEIIQLGGPRALTGDEVCATFSQALGRPLSYEMTPVETFKSYLAAGPGPHIAEMIGGLYQAIQTAPDQLQPGFVLDAEAIATRFGVELTTLDQWIAFNRAAFTGIAHSA